MQNLDRKNLFANINDNQTIEVKNRFSSLVQNKEWLREAEDYYDVDVENKSEGPSSNVGKSVKSRKKIEVEKKSVCASQKGKKVVDFADDRCVGIKVEG